ncbi:cytochrome b [Luteimonas sp. SDU101]|uniref:cytochrome b n=1 Tax=Luteimonas sp. SDU101 TaxID=3422593 RepID=UPI003EBE4295
MNSGASGGAVVSASAPGSPTHWPAGVRWLHWLGVAMILAVAVIGLSMGGLERGSELRRLAYLGHKSLGLAVLALALLRLAMRASTRAPAAAGAGWSHRIAQATHLLLYLLMLAVPLSGWMLNSVAGQPLVWFGLFDVPALAERNPDWRGAVDALHLWLFWLLAALVALHVLAVALHQWVLRDGTAWRMLPGSGRSAR